MEYLVTFDDGSSAFLSHHGTKGMKWGVWNAETKAKYGMNAPQAGGGGGGGVEEEEEDEEDEKAKLLDAEKFGYKNTSEGRKAAYAEMGFDRKWSREKGMEVARNNYVNAMLSGNGKMTTEAYRNIKRRYELEKEMASTLPTRAEKNRNLAKRNERAKKLYYRK